MIYNVGHFFQKFYETGHLDHLQRKNKNSKSKFSTLYSAISLDHFLNILQNSISLPYMKLLWLSHNLSTCFCLILARRFYDIISLHYQWKWQKYHHKRQKCNIEKDYLKGLFEIIIVQNFSNKVSNTIVTSAIG